MGVQGPWLPPAQQPGRVFWRELGRCHRGYKGSDIVGGETTKSKTWNAGCANIPLYRTSDHLPPTLTGSPAGSPDLPAQIPSWRPATRSSFGQLYWRDAGSCQMFDSAEAI